MDTGAVAAMLREDRDEWEALVAVLEAHTEEGLHETGSPSWTSRDVYAHLARWIGHSTAHLEARLAGRTLPPLEGADDEINARWQQEDSRLTLDEARERARTTFERRLRVVDAVPIDRWDEELQAIARADGAEHYRGHRSYIVTP
jgi:hypothetical protein